MNQFKKDGFTLMEMVIVVGIVASLASIGIPGYLEYKHSSDQASSIPIIRAYINAFQQAVYQDLNFFKLSGKKYKTAYGSDKVCTDSSLAKRQCFRAPSFKSSTDGKCNWYVQPYRDSDGSVAFHAYDDSNGQNCGCYNYLLKKLDIEFETSPCSSLTNEIKEKIAELYGVEMIFGFDINERFQYRTVK